MKKSGRLRIRDLVVFCARLKSPFTLQEVIQATLRECPERVDEFAGAWHNALDAGRILRTSSLPDLDPNATFRVVMSHRVRLWCKAVGLPVPPLKPGRKKRSEQPDKAPFNGQEAGPCASGKAVSTGEQGNSGLNDPEDQGLLLTEKQRQEVLEAAKPLIRWLNENCHPQCVARVDQNTVILLEGVATSCSDKFLKD